MRKLNHLLLACICSLTLACDAQLSTSSMPDESSPDDPLNPADPSRPSDPKDPTDPADPTDPSNPTNPGDLPKAPPRDPPPGSSFDGSNPNTLDHNKLFVCDPSKKTLTTGRLWRLNAQQYRNTGARVIGSSGPGFINPFAGSVSPKSFANYAELFTLEEANVDGLINSASQISAHTLKDRAPGCMKSAIKDNDPSKFTEGCRRGAVQHLSKILLGRPMTKEEEDKYQARMLTLFNVLGFPDGINASIELMLTHPEALFRFELGEDAQGAQPRKLTPYELTSALSLTLIDRPPSDTLLKLAEDRSIQDPAVLAEQARQLMATTKEWEFKAVVRAFIVQYFKYDEVVSAFKDVNFQGNTGGELRKTEKFINWLVDQDERFIEQLLTSTTSFNGGHQDYTPSQDPERPGILHHRSWLAGFAKSNETDPIHRGRFIREALLCQQIPSIPIGVIPQLPDPTESTTMRERLAQHSSDASCQTCHNMMDPLGLPFERYDLIGLPRDMEAGRPVDTTGEFINAGPLNGPIQDSHQMVRAMAESDYVKQCFVRHLFRFTMGRDETYGDACTLQDAYETYTMTNGSLKATMESLITSDTFTTRAPNTGEMP